MRHTRITVSFVYKNVFRIGVTEQYGVIAS